MDLSAWFQELRRRRVIRALLGWGLLSFAVLQVIEPVQHALGLGEWMLKLVVVLLAVGFPVTAGLAWAFDLTRKGVERAEPAGANRADARPVLAPVAAGALVGAAVAGLAGWHLWGRTPESGPDGRITIAVADFVNETKEADLDGLSGQLITSLEQSQKLRVLTRSRMVDVLRQLGKPPVPVVDEVLGREMALAAGVRALVVATIRRFDQLYAIDLKVLDPSTSEYFFTLKEEQRGKEAIPSMLDRLSEKARERLREAPAQVSATRLNVADATTRNYQAWQAYFEGLKEEDALRLTGAIARYRKAVELDPRFALAWYRIAYLGEFVWLPEEDRNAAMEAAFREIDRVPAKERVLIQAWKAHMENRQEESHALYALAAEAFPQDKDVLYMAGDLHFHQGKYAESLRWFEKALALDPSWPEALGHAIEALAALGRAEEALTMARAWAEKAPGKASRLALVEALLAVHRPGEALEVARRIAVDDPATTGTLAFTLIRAERFEEAEGLLRPLAMPGADLRVGNVALLLLALTYQGRIREALKVVDQHAGLPGSPWWFGLGLGWNVLAAGRRTQEALRRANALDEGDLERGAPASQFAIWYLHVGDERSAGRAASRIQDPDRKRLYDAVLAWRRGELESALVAIRAIDAPPSETSDSAWCHAIVAFDARQDAEAVAAADRFETFKAFTPWRGGRSAELLYRKALAQERLGDTAGARASVERLLGWWRRADPDLPLLAEAKALCKKLECRPADLLPRK